MGGGHAGLHTTIVFVTVIQEAIGEINTFNWLDGWMVGLAKKHGDHGDLGSDDLGDIYVYIYIYVYIKYIDVYIYIYFWISMKLMIIQTLFDIAFDELIKKNNKEEWES